MRIVLSGGWGYGNLGDDAILDATIQLLEKRFSGCEIDVLTYNVADSLVHAKPHVRLRPCLHSFIDAGASGLYFPPITKNQTYFSKSWLKLKFALTEHAAWFAAMSSCAGAKSVAAIIKGADLFVMAGGGYFNEKWLSKTRSHLQELSIATHQNVPVYILGPTIGKFSPNLQRQVLRQIGMARLVTVRDQHSLAEAECAGGPVKLIPDVALSSWLPHAKAGPSNTVGVIFTSQDAGFQDRVATALSNFVGSGGDRHVRLFISRLWKLDHRNAMSLQKRLLVHGVSSSFVMCSDFHQLERELAACHLVISENLHGLILAARNAVPVIAVNDYAPGSPNYKKFIAFLAQSESEDMFIRADTTPSSMILMLEKLDRIHEETVSRLQRLRVAVLSSYMAAV